MVVHAYFDLAKKMAATDNIDEWNAILSGAIQSSHSSLKRIPVHLAVQKKCECLEHILQDSFAGHFDLNAFARSGYRAFFTDHETLLTLLVNDAKLSILKNLLNFEVDLNRKHRRGSSPFVCALNQYLRQPSPTMWSILRLLIAHGCDINSFAFHQHPSRKM